MLDFRPVGYVIGLLVSALGATMGLPLLVDVLEGEGHWRAFALSAFLTLAAGGVITIACAQRRRAGLTIQQTFLLTTLSWLALPVFGALPFVFGETQARFTDAFFESMSGLTTTGATVFSGLDAMPQGILLWRALLQWIGGIGVVVFAMAFLPMLKVGGMQLFRTESFDTFGKILPRAAEIAASISGIYVGLTAACAGAYGLMGMHIFDATTHAMTTIATGGFANYDASFAAFEPQVEYAATLFMVLASLPFVRYVQLLAGSARPLWRDPQVRAFLGVVAAIVAVLGLWRIDFAADALEPAFRKALFNGVSILTGTGYASEDYNQWGAFPVAVFFLIGLVGGCAGSTCCSIKIFRFQVVAAAVVTQIQRIHSPNGVFFTRYDGRRLDEDVIGSVMAFLFMFVATLATLAVALAMLGLDPLTAISGAATAIANVGPGLGEIIGPAGNFASLSDTAKWILSAGMLVGRLELMSVYVLFTAAFWRA